MLKALSQTRNSHSRWVIVAASFLFVLVLWSPYSGFGVFVPRFTEQFGWQRGTITSVFSVVMIIGAPVGFLIGRLMDRYGPRKVALAEVGFCFAAYILASRIESLWQIYIFLGLLLGMGFAGAYIIPTTVAAKWFNENRGLALGIVLSGQGLGYLLGPLLAVGLIEGFGWRTAFLILGLAVAALGIIPASLLRDPPDAAQVQAPASPSGSSRPMGNSTLPRPASKISFRQALGTSTFWMLSLVWAFQAFAQMMFTIHVVPLLVDKGIDLAASAAALSFYGLGLLSGRLLSGPGSDRYGASFVLAVAAAIGALSLALLIISGELTMLYASAFGFGIAVSGGDTAYARALPDIVGVGRLGTVMSGLNIGWRIGGAAGPAFGGIAFDMTHVYALPFGLSILGLLLSIGLFLAAARPKQKLDLILERRSLAT